MYCEKCQIEMEGRKATVQHPYAYDLSGLRNIFLAGILVRVCPRCHAEVPVIPRIAELHRVIARALVSKPALLNGEEIRFLRKQAGFPAQKFAALLGVSPEHLSRFENGHYLSLSKSADRLARAIATVANDGETARDVLLKIANELEKKGQMAEQRPLFSLEQNHWKAAA
jgi:putative zinc finger/helix-turn-helix YgiT family protein